MGEFIFPLVALPSLAPRDFFVIKAKSPRSMAFLPLRGLLEVELSESHLEFQTARGETRTAAKLSSLRSRHIHFVEYLRCALACTAAAKLAL